MAKIACSLLKNKADLCLKIQMKLLLGWGSKEGIYMLWNEWHACANSRRPQAGYFQGIRQSCIYCTFSPLDPKVSPLARSERPLAFVGRMRWGVGTGRGKVKWARWLYVCDAFFYFPPRLLFLCFVSLCCFSNHCSLNSVVRNFLFTFYYNGLFKMIDRSLSWPKTRLALNVEKKSGK